MNELFFLAIFSLLIVLPFLLARFFNKRFTRQNPNCKQYFWGFYSACAIPIFQPFILAGQLHNTEISILRFATTFSFVILIPFSIMTIRRSRIGFIMLTILTLNPIAWIINSFYIKNRWNEFN